MIVSKSWIRISDLHSISNHEPFAFPDYFLLISMRRPIIGGRLYGRGSSSQSAGVERPPMEQMEEIVPPVPVERGSRPISKECSQMIAGISKQGRVFGLGSLQTGVSMSLNDSTVPQPATEDVGTLTRRVTELETELQKGHDENVDIKKRLETLEKIVESLFGHNVLASTNPSAYTPT